MGALSLMAVTSLSQYWPDLTGPQRATTILGLVVAAASVVAGVVGSWTGKLESKLEKTVKNLRSDKQASLQFWDLDNPTSGLNLMNVDEMELALYRNAVTPNSTTPETDAILKKHFEDDIMRTTEAEGKKAPPPLSEQEWDKKIHDTEVDFTRRKAKVTIQTKIAFSFMVLAETALAIAFTVWLAQDLKSGDLTQYGRRLARAQIGLMWAAVAVEAMAVGVGAFGLFAGGTFAMAIPYIGIIIAIVCIVLSVLYMGDKARKKEEPAPTPTEIFIRDHGRPLIDGLDEVPPARLSYWMEETGGWKGNTDKVILIHADNISSQDVIVGNTSFFIFGGSDDSCLLKETTLVNGGILAQGETHSIQPGVVEVARTAGNDKRMELALVSTPYGTLTTYECMIVPGRAAPATDNTADGDDEEVEDATDGPPPMFDPTNLPWDVDEAGFPAVVIPPGQGFVIKIRGTVNPVGKYDDGRSKKGLATIDVVEQVSNGDKTLTRMEIQRMN